MQDFVWQFFTRCIIFFIHPSFIVGRSLKPGWALTDLPVGNHTLPLDHVNVFFCPDLFPQQTKLTGCLLFVLFLLLVGAGPDHVTIFISPLPGSHIVSWSFGHLEPVLINTLPTLEDEGRDTHFVYYAYGQKPSKPWSFYINLYVRCAA